MELYEEMTMNNYQWHNFRAKSNKLAYVYNVNAIIALFVQVKTLSKKIDRLTGTK